ERPEQFLALVPGEVQQRVYVGDWHLFGSRSEFDDRVARLYLALLEHAEVEPGAVVRDEQGGNPRVFHPDPDAVARYARLRDLEDRRTDLEPVANTYLVIAQAFHG